MEIHIYRDDSDNSHRFNRPNYKPFVYIERYNFTLYIESAKTSSHLVFPIALAIIRVIDIQEVGYLYKSYERPHNEVPRKGSLRVTLIGFLVGITMAECILC